MSNNEIIDTVAEATDQMDAAPPERTATDITTGAAIEVQERSAVRRHHQGTRLVAGTELPVVPADHEMAQMAQMAVTIAGATTAPRALQGNPNDAFMILLTARDVGVGLTTAVREFHVIDGKVTLSPKVKMAMVKQQGAGKVYPHQAPRQQVINGEMVTIYCPCGSDGPANGDTEATWHAERRDEPGILHTSTFTMEMAQRVRARENKQNITLAEKSTWKQYPQRMLSWRALGYLLDDVFPEVGTGLYSPDEMGAVTDEDGVPVIDVVGQARPVPGTRAPRQHEARQAAAEIPPASDEQKAALKARIGVLAAHSPDARTALVTLWTAKRDDDSPALPQLDFLKANQVAKAEAMVASVEQRAHNGEWGPWEPDAEAAGDDETPETSEGHDDAPDEPQSDSSDEPGDADEAEVTRDVIEHVRAMKKADLTAALADVGLGTSGNMDTLRHRLASHMIATRTTK